MSLSISQAAYTDCYEALDRALEDTVGIRIAAPSLEDAMYLRARIHHARKLARNKNAEVYADEPTHPLYGKSEYDVLVCRVKRKADEFFVYIEHRPSLMDRVESLADTEDDADTVVDLRPEEKQPPTIVRRI